MNLSFTQNPPLNRLNISFLPLFTSPAGRALSFKNWETLGIQQAAFDLETLLKRPGLYSQASLKAYTGWQGRAVINGARLTFNKKGIYSVSGQGGARLALQEEELSLFLEQQKAQMILLPKILKDRMPQVLKQLSQATLFLEMEAFFSLDLIPPQVAGFYLSAAELLSKKFEHFLPACLKYPCYLYDLDDFALLENLPFDSIYVESDQPAADACQGFLYHKEEDIIDIQAALMVQDHRPLEFGCSCPSCQLPFTRAYFHHLFSHTPLLCQRLLIQHNITYTNKNFFSA